MAFVLLAFMLLFGLVLMFYVSLRLSSLKTDVTDIRQEHAQELARRLANSPEFSWTVEDCASCIDMDKIFVLKSKGAAYTSLWGTSLAMVRVQTAYPVPARDVECTSATYPDCTRITLIDSGKEYSTEESFVALCRLEGHPVSKKCTLGKILIGVDSA